jgi:predicted signal transduction protein with EAL and GGDEF domain
VAERLRRSVRPQDLVARLGGDEFAVLLEGAGTEHVDGIAERVLALLAEPITVAGRQLCVQASVGISDAGPGLDAEQLLSRADLAMYAAKDAGKGRYARYAGDMAPRTSPRAQVIAELHGALERDELVLVYQPIVRLPLGEGWEGVEALLRWRHPERGMVPPPEFIPTAEETGLIVPIGRWVLRTACRQAAEWLERFPATAPATMNVNVSARQLRDPGFVAEVTGALAEAGLAPERLVIEVTESAIVDHAPAAAILRALRGLGVRVALDDFGTGYSTLSLLDALPVDQLKLDRTLLGQPGRDAVAVAVMRIAETIGAGLVAEGVEGTGQAERLYAMGYPLAQGYLFARPAPAEVITEQLAADEPAGLTVGQDVGGMPGPGRDIVAG